MKDIMADKKKLPNLIIGGVNKAGTTSLHTYLSWHTSICASTIKETNYFVPLLYNQKLPPLDKYTEFFRDCNDNSKYIMESTPRYVYGGEKLAKVIYDRLGLIKIIFLLREPVQRLFSYYNHMKDNNEIPQNMLFDDYVDRALKDLINLTGGKNHTYIDVYSENVYIRGLAQGFYTDYLSAWYYVFGDCAKVYFFEDLKNKPLMLMNLICNWLEIDPAIYESANFSVENKRISYKSKMLHDTVSALNDKFERFFRTHYYLKNSLRNIYYLLNESNSKKEVIPAKTLKKLEEVYEPYNRQLFHLLTSRGYSDVPDWINNNL